jgi:hypothetical protein
MTTRSIIKPIIKSVIKPIVKTGGTGGGPALPITSVNANGWSVVYPSPPTEFAPDVTPETFSVSRAGYTTAGATTTYSESMTLTKRVRQAFPNQASLTASDVAINDYLYSTDSVSGATNNSTETSPKPIANWEMFDRTVVGNTLNLEVACFHRNARSREQVACVEFRVSDGTTEITQVVNTSSVSTRYSSIGQKVIVYAASIDVSTLANPATLTVNAKVFPWVGGVGSVLDSADNSLARELSPRFFRRDTALLASPRVAYVRTAANGGNDGTGVVSTTPATASANPFATVLAAINAHHTAGGLDGAIIYIGNDGGTPFVLGSTAGTRTQSAAEIIITRETSVARANARVSFGAAAFRPRFGAAGGWLRFNDVGVVRDGTNTIQGEAASRLDVVFDDVDFVGNSHNAAVVSSTGTVWYGGVNASSLGGAMFTSFTGQATRCIRNCTIPSPTGIEGFNCIGNTITNQSAAVLYTASSQSGSICAFNRIQGFGSANGAINIAASAAATGAAIVQNVFEYTSATSGPAIRISADSATGDTTHVVLHHNTFAGFYNNGRGNIFYDDGPTARTNKLQSCKGNIHVAINTKSDVFQASGTRIGNWAFENGVGCEGEFSQFIDADLGGVGSGFAQDYPGLRASIGTSSTVRNDPLFIDDEATSAGPLAGLGGGNYRLGSGSPADNRVSPVLRFDLDGNARSASLATSGAYEL